jgi:hypothetical protein
MHVSPACSVTVNSTSADDTLRCLQRALLSQQVEGKSSLAVLFFVMWNQLAGYGLLVQQHPTSEQCALQDYNQGFGYH